MLAWPTGRIRMQSSGGHRTAANGRVQQTAAGVWLHNVAHTDIDGHLNLVGLLGPRFGGR